MPDFKENAPAFAAMLGALGMSNGLAAVEQPADSYSPCWCGSGKKWKFCHKVREKMPRLTYGQIKNEHDKLTRSGPCQHPEASPETCSSRDAIQSHTLQRRGGLAVVAENGHVYSIKKGFDNVEKNDGVVDMEKLGVGKASVFPGYCNTHDTALFKPVEKSGAVLDDMNGFLLSLRAVGYELAAKRGQLEGNKYSLDVVDRGQPFERQMMVQNFLRTYRAGIERGLADVLNLKSKFDTAYLNQDLTEFSLYAITFDGVLPFAVAGAFMPEYDFAGNQLQNLATQKAISQISLNVTELGGNTCVVFGWFGGPNCAAANLVSSFQKIPNEEKANALLLASLEHLENIYFTPSWWDGLSADVAAKLHQAVNGGMPGTIRSPTALFEPGIDALNYEILRVHEKSAGS